MIISMLTIYPKSGIPIQVIFRRTASIARGHSLDSFCISKSYRLSFIYYNFIYFSTFRKQNITFAKKVFFCISKYKAKKRTQNLFRKQHPLLVYITSFQFESSLPPSQTIKGHVLFPPSI